MPDSDDVDERYDGNYYEIVGIKARRVVGNCIDYEVRFAGYSHESDMWIPEENIDTDYLLERWDKGEEIEC